MKKLMVGLAVCFMLAMVPAIALTAGTDAPAGYWEPFTLFSSATTTTGPVSTNIQTFKHPVTTISCDIHTVPTATINFQLLSNLSYTTGFATTEVGKTSTALMSAATYSNQINRKTIASEVMRSIKALITANTDTTAIVTIRCIGTR